MDHRHPVTCFLALLVLLTEGSAQILLNESSVQLSSRGDLIAVGALRFVHARRARRASSSDSSFGSFGSFLGTDAQQHASSSNVKLFAAQPGAVLSAELTRNAGDTPRLTNPYGFPLNDSITPPAALALDRDAHVLTVSPQSLADAHEYVLPDNSTLDSLEQADTGLLLETSRDALAQVCPEEKIAALASLDNASRGLVACEVANRSISLRLLEIDADNNGSLVNRSIEMPGAFDEDNKAVVDMSVTPDGSALLLLSADISESSSKNSMDVRLLPIPALDLLANSTLMENCDVTYEDTLVGEMRENHEFSFERFSSIAAFQSGRSDEVRVALLTNETEATTLVDFKLGHCNVTNLAMHAEEMNSLQTSNSDLNENKCRLNLRPQCIGKALRNEGRELQYKPRVDYVGTPSGDPALLWSLYIVTLLGSLAILTLWFGWESFKTWACSSTRYKDLERRS